LNRELTVLLVGAFVQRQWLRVIDGLPSGHRCARYNAIARAIKTMFQGRITDMPVLAEHTINAVMPHETVFVRGGSGGIQKVPWNLPADGDVHFAGFGDGALFGTLGALTDGEKQKLAERIASSPGPNIQDILAIIPTDAERREVAALAVARGADAFWIQRALDGLETKQSWKALNQPLPMPARIIWGVLSTASFAACVYHGYKRNNSVGWAIGWGVLGAIFPVITPTIAVAQGFGKPKKSGGFGRAHRRKTKTYEVTATGVERQRVRRLVDAKTKVEARRKFAKWMDETHSIVSVEAV
jgi:hypothetical protein